METYKIFWHSDSPFTATGYASQSLFLLNELSKKGWDIDYQSHNYPGCNLPKGSVKLADDTPFNFNLYGCGKQPYSQDVLIPRIKAFKPDYFITLLDTFMNYPWMLDKDFSPAKTGFWFPSDGGYFPTNCEQLIQRMDLPVAMAKFGQRQLDKNYNIKTHHIPHGVDTNSFKPIDKEAVKIKYGLQGKFIVGTVARNQGRKMMDRTIKAFHLFAKQHEDVILLMHTDPTDAAAVFDIQELVKRYKLENRVKYTGVNFFSPFTYAQMNEVYNCMDVFMLSTSGEGFGVPIIEALSTEVPCVVTDYTTTREFLTENKECGLPVNILGCKDYDLYDDVSMGNGTITGTWSVERGLIDVKHCATQLDKLYNDEKLRKLYGKNGRQNCLELYDWKIVGNAWDKLLREGLSE